MSKQKGATTDHIRVSVEYIPAKGKNEKWGTITEIPVDLNDRAMVHEHLSENMVHTIAAVLKR